MIICKYHQLAHVGDEKDIMCITSEIMDRVEVKAVNQDCLNRLGHCLSLNI